MATVSVRKLIVAATVTQLKTITIANGYNTDVNSNVVDRQLTNVALATLPNIEVRDLSEESEVRGTMDYKTLTLELVARIAATTIDAARNLLTDITEAMKLKPAFPSNVYQFQSADNPDLTPEQLDKKATRLTLTYTVKYRE